MIRVIGIVDVKLFVKLNRIKRGFSDGNITSTNNLFNQGGSIVTGIPGLMLFVGITLGAGFALPRFEAQPLDRLRPGKLDKKPCALAMLTSKGQGEGQV
jgi:hypothetical protein